MSEAQPAPAAPGQEPLRRATRLLYWAVVAPLVARLPASFAYGLARLQGDWTFRHWPEQQSQLAVLQQVLGDELDLDSEALQGLAQDFCRFRACEVIDVMRLHGRSRSLRGLVDVRGQQHLEAALAEGRGAILCGAHFGSSLSTFSLLHDDGFPVTTIGRWEWKYASGLTSVERWLWDRVYAGRVLRHRQRPNIEPWRGRSLVALQAAVALRHNEVVSIAIDAPPLPADRDRSVEVPFLGGQATLLPGVVELAEITGAPILMAFAHRRDDCRHQVLEISAPVPTGGGPEAVFARCVAAVDAAIRAHPADWYFCFPSFNLAALGLLRSAEGDAPAHSMEAGYAR